ncbi:MAG: sel1 repeat family protein [Rhodocyclaceae bacterium]|nr:sel1 repeat family protein [Rhodocyclaceae bacterium]
MTPTLEQLLGARARIAFAAVRDFRKAAPPPVDTATPELEDEHREALEDFRARAEAGDAYAQWIMGRAAEKGLADPSGPGAARAWYERAAAGDLPEAINDLAVERHRACDPNPASGEALIAAYERAADGGLAEALCNLGLAFHHYRGYTGRAKGNVLFEEAAVAGVPEADSLRREPPP